MLPLDPDMAAVQVADVFNRARALVEAQDAGEPADTFVWLLWELVESAVAIYNTTGGAGPGDP